MNLKELREKAMAATQGEWMCTDGIVMDGKIRTFVNDENLIPILYIDHYRPDPDISNEKFIAAANPNTIISLLDTIEELNKDKEALRDVARFYANQDHWIGYHRDCTSILDDDVKAKASDDFDIIVGGRRAREVLEKIATRRIKLV